MTMYILYSLLYIRYKIGAFSSFCSFSRLLHFVFFFCVTIMLCIFAAVWFEQHVKPSGVLICIYEVEEVCLNKGCHPTSSPLWAGAIQKKRSKVGVKASSSHPASAAVWHLCSLCVSDNLPLAYPFLCPHYPAQRFHGISPKLWPGKQGRELSWDLRCPRLLCGYFRLRHPLRPLEKLGRLAPKP